MAAKYQTKPSQEEGSRKRSRLGDPALTSSLSGAADPKKRAAAKPGPAKPVRKQKPGGEESRLGAKRQKKDTDLKFEESCQAVIGSRVGVWWDDDNCYYKASLSASLASI